MYEKCINAPNNFKDHEETYGLVYSFRLEQRYQI